MKVHGQPGHLAVSLGEEPLLDVLTQLFPQAIADAHERVARTQPGSVSLIANMSTEEFFADRSDEMAIVGELKK